MKNDSVIKRVRSARHSISEQQGHDPQKLVAYYIQKQQAHRDRLRKRMPRTAPASSKQT